MSYPFPEIKTTNLLLRQFRDEDLDNVFEGLSHPEVIKYYGVSYATKNEAKQQLVFFKDLEKNETGTWWAVCSADENVFYGGCGINNFNRHQKKAEIGFWLLKQYWGKGIMQEAAPLVCNYCFGNLKLIRLEAIVETGNAASIKLLTKLGFRQEHIKTNAEIKNGKAIDLILFAKLAGHSW